MLGAIIPHHTKLTKADTKEIYSNYIIMIFSTSFLVLDGPAAHYFFKSTTKGFAELETTLIELKTKERWAN